MQVSGSFTERQMREGRRADSKTSLCKTWVLQKQKHAAVSHLGAACAAGGGGRPRSLLWYLGNGFCKGSCISPACFPRGWSGFPSLWEEGRCCTLGGELLWGGPLFRAGPLLPGAVLYCRAAEGERRAPLPRLRSLFK